MPNSAQSTKEARQLLPELVPHRQAARNSSRSALLVHALTADPTLLLEATEDSLHQEYRRSAFPTSMSLVDALRGEGWAAVVSGAGPTVLVITTESAAPDAAARIRTWTSRRLRRSLHPRSCRSRMQVLQWSQPRSDVTGP
ncbi:hypothetical protein [Nesterenkonia pannonica]|uniref:hypothetical protein n=1 Tax=Nesterenkonia pannonica TaxID=1548602 RepID=UPI002164EDB0|nr:hypothetical protein [Nesterenkonia pannonica]